MEQRIHCCINILVIHLIMVYIIPLWVICGVGGALEDIIYVENEVNNTSMSSNKYRIHRTCI